MPIFKGRGDAQPAPKKPKKDELFKPRLSAGDIVRLVLTGLGALLLVGYFVWQNFPTGLNWFRRQSAIDFPANPGIGSSVVSPLDGMTLMYVPAGEFTMGSPEEDGSAGKDEKPMHQVYLDAFWIDRTEVTNAQYALCVEKRGCQQFDNTSTSTRSYYYGTAQYANYPVTHVTWEQASAYCTWAERRLPTEAEWEKAARGTDQRLYPWGNEPPNENLLNFHSLIGDTTEVGSYPAGASPYGALDMAGNVWEYVNDWYNKNYYSNSPYENPQGPETGRHHVVRGGSWGSIAWSLRTTMRYWIELKGRVYVDYGFRCAMSATR